MKEGCVQMLLMALFVLITAALFALIRISWPGGGILGDIIAAFMLAIPVFIYIFVLGLCLVLIGYSLFKRPFTLGEILVISLSAWGVICLTYIFWQIAIQQLSWRLVGVDSMHTLTPIFLSFLTATFGAIVTYIPIAAILIAVLAALSGVVGFRQGNSLPTTRSHH